MSMSMKTEAQKTYLVYVDDIVMVAFQAESEQETRDLAAKEVGYDSEMEMEERTGSSSEMLVKELIPFSELSYSWQQVVLDEWGEWAGEELTREQLIAKIEAEGPIFTQDAYRAESV